uniref:Uncharacterized protein n=1 Tax=Bartonella rochalimae ATCC BAA-1498 TaxID=685782 RepID=E6YL07_9HYPH|nr:hypothetical protein BARRO_30126 [Bartonella rochalimae ATCC BAA-1498]
MINNIRITLNHRDATLHFFDKKKFSQLNQEKTYLVYEGLTQN